VTLEKDIDSGSLDSGSLDEWGLEDAPPSIFLKRVHRPSRLSVIVKAPDGSPITRWAQDEPNLQNVFSGLTFSGEMPGGHKELSLTLHRDPKLSYRDLALFNRIEVYSSDGDRVWCGTIRQEPTSDGGQQSIEVKAAGDMQFLEDDPTVVGPGFIDGDLSKWGDASSQRKIEAKTLKINSDGTASLLPAGAGGAGVPAAISHAWSTLDTVPATSQSVVESWYDAGGVEIGDVWVEFVPGAGIGVSWHNRVYGCADNQPSVAEELDDFAGTFGALGLNVVAGRFALLLQSLYPNEFHGEGPFEGQWRNVKVLGRQGLALQGNWPDVGFLAKQMIPAILEGSALTTDPELLEDDGFVIPQAWFSAPGTRMSKLIEVTKYGLLDWFVFGDRILQYRFPGTYGRTWRLGPGNGPKNSGADANQVFDRLMVSYQDVDGTTKYTDLLTTTDPSNPAAAAGVPRGKLLALNGVCTEELALEVRQRAFEELQNLSQSGEVTLTDHVQDEASGAWYPVSYVQPGDRVREQSNGHERKVTSTNYSDESVSNSLTIGAPPEGMGAIEARFNGRLIELGLGG
jgi:hypothetical protein